MTCEAVYESHSNYNRTHEAVHELMNNNLLTSCNWFMHGVNLISQSNVQMSIRKLLTNLSKLFCIFIHTLMYM